MVNDPLQQPVSPVTIGPGTVVDSRYKIVRELGRGGMGTVYEAEQILLKKRVALKVMLAEQHERGLKTSKRFLREARIASSIKHRNVVDTVDFGDLDDLSTYYVMELLEGRDLSSLLKADGPMAWPRARAILRQVLSGLTAAHEQGIIHRDIKPANIVLLDEADQWGNEWVKVLDFGIAKIQHADEESQALTGTSEILGTAKYMAPELVRGDPPDARTDLYAVGIVAYQLLTGSAPFREENTFKLLMQHMKEAPSPPSERSNDVPAAVDAFVLRALAKKPAARYQSATDMRDVLDELGDEPAPPPPVVGGATQIAGPGMSPMQPATQAYEPPGSPTTVDSRALAGGTVLAEGTPSTRGHAGNRQPASPTAPQFQTPSRPIRRPKDGGIKLWMVLIPVLAIAAGVAVGLFM